MDRYVDANRRGWDELAAQHVQGLSYDVDGFKAGRLSLQRLEREELGDVNGKSLLHLQCHFGMDTLSWAHLGARVTGADFSPEAIRIATNLASEVGVDARFVCSDLAGLPRNLSGTFDIVFTSYGVLRWLPDLVTWAGTIAHFLKPGGRFYIVDHHPVVAMLDEDATEPELRVRRGYFYRQTPEEYDPAAVGGEARRSGAWYEWAHGLGEVVSILVDSGLTIIFLHEFAFSEYPSLRPMRKGDDSLWRLPDGFPQIPLLFSLEARRPS